MKKRSAVIKRRTKETAISVTLDLNRPARVSVATSIPFMDHMLTLFARHGMVGLTVKASGDTQIDDHHLVEDLGIALGQALESALGDKKGIYRYGNFLLPMDEALAYVALDLSGRPFLSYEVPFTTGRTGFDFDLVQEFFSALAANSRMTLHVRMIKGRNNHHIAESLFKGFGRALAQAIAVDRRQAGIPSTKGRL
jgi:imidazoleglycerol phosphate dehydratase HisB